MIAEKDSHSGEDIKAKVSDLQQVRISKKMGLSVRYPSSFPQVRSSW